MVARWKHAAHAHEGGAWHGEAGWSRCLELVPVQPQMEEAAPSDPVLGADGAVRRASSAGCERQFDRERVVVLRMDTLFLSTARGISTQSPLRC